MGASQSQAEDDSHGHAHADGSIHHGHSHSHGGSQSSGLIPAALTAAQLHAAPSVAPNSAYLASTHAPVTLAAPTAIQTNPAAVTSSAAPNAPTGSSPAVSHVAHPTFTTQSTSTLGTTAVTTGTTVAQTQPAAVHAENASHAQSQPTQVVGHHPQAAPTGAGSSTTTATTQHQPASATKTATAAAGGAAVAASTKAPHHEVQPIQQPVQTTSSSSYGAVPISSNITAPVDTLTPVPTAGHTNNSQMTVTTTTGPGGVVRSEYHSAAATPKDVVRLIAMAPVAVQPGFASEVAEGNVVTSQPAVHAGASADRATLASSPATTGTTTIHVAPVSTGQVVAPPTLYQTLAPTAGDVAGVPQSATTTQPAAARASATTTITTGTVSSTTTSTASTAPTSAPATSTTSSTPAPVPAASAAHTSAAIKSDEPSSPNRPAKVARGMQTGLWSQLISWCNPLLPQGVVLAWDERDVAEMVLALPHSAHFKATLQQRQLERKKRRKQQALEQAEAAAKGIKVPAQSPTSTLTPTITSPHSTTQLPVPYELASVLLSLDKTLSSMRLQWVPSRVSEDTFFVEYFGAIVASINAHVTRVETELTGKVGGPTVHDRISQIEERSKVATA